MASPTLNLLEIFWSVQGEGLHVGEPSVFVRTGGCDLRCTWCDSPETWKAAVACRVETEPGGARFESIPGNVDVETVVKAVDRLFGARPGLVSITGGEPLLQPAGVRALAAGLRARGMRTLLETHGLHAEALERVAAEIDVVSMDWKLASGVRRESDPRHGAVAAFHDAHEEFLRRALAGEGGDRGGVGEVYVKVVVTADTQDAELLEVCARIGRTAREVPLILQPVTPHGPVRETPDAARMLAWVRACRERLEDVRMIPQTHKMVGVL